jgi:AraC family transcriptional regulator
MTSFAMPSETANVERLRPSWRKQSEYPTRGTALERRVSRSCEVIHLDTGRNFPDRTVKISPNDLVTRHSTGCDGFIAETIYAPAGSTFEVRYRGSAHLLVLYEEGVRRQGETSIDGFARSNLRGFSKKMTFVPAGRCLDERQEINAPTRITYLYLDQARLRQFADVSYLPRIFFEDVVLWTTAAKLRSVIQTEQAKSERYLNAVANVLAQELAWSSQAPERKPTTNRGGLAGWQMRAITSYIEENLNQQISLVALAGRVRLSQFHFCRAFKESFGVPPLRYHLERRIQRAKELLSDPKMSITEAGLILGYAQTGSFSLAFRKVTGQTPSQFRRNFTRNNEDAEVCRTTSVLDGREMLSTSTFV